MPYSASGVVVSISHMIECFRQTFFNSEVGTRSVNFSTKKSSTNFKVSAEILSSVDYSLTSLSVNYARSCLQLPKLLKPLPKLLKPKTIPAQAKRAALDKEILQLQSESAAAGWRLAAC